MKIPFVDLQAQYRSIKPEIDQAIHAVLDRGEFVQGPFVASFEENFAKRNGSKYCVAVSSGTSALHLAMWAMGINNGDEVIVPANTFIASASSISLAGAKPVFVDCDDKYYNLDPQKIEKAITKKTKGIVVVHLYGQPAQLDKIKEIAKKHNLKLIEDCAQAHLALYKGKPVGTYGEVGCYSFYPSKNLGAYGEGGAVVTEDKALYEKMKALREHGGKVKYHYDDIGQNYRMHGIQGAILDVKLKYLDKWNASRRENAKQYNSALGIEQIILPEEMEGVSHVYHLYVIRTDKRESLQKFLEKNGIAVGIHYPIPCHLQQCYQFLKYPKGSFPVTEEHSSQLLSLPMYPELTSDQIDYVTGKIKEFYKSNIPLAVR